MPLQLSSLPEGAPRAQLSATCPATQLVMPVRAQAPTPHAVALGTKSSSAVPLRTRSVDHVLHGAPCAG
jgi:hypothetical protein